MLSDNMNGQFPQYASCVHPHASRPQVSNSFAFGALAGQHPGVEDAA